MSNMRFYEYCKFLCILLGLECRLSTKGSEYRGKRNTTINGKTCQRWDSQTPHKHKISADTEENYCRNAGNFGALWCYTTDPKKRWELCTVPLCSGQCQSPPLESPGVDIFNPPSDGFAVEFNATIGCITGYETSSGQLATVSVICKTDRSWTQSSSLACNKVQCPSPKPNPYSTIAYPKSKYEYQDRISIVCDTGYTIQGLNTLTCQADKSWNSSLPTCNKVQCPSPTTTPNSRIMNPQPQYLYQQSISIVCDTGYTLQGQSTLTCQADKSWSHSLPTCSKVQCPSPTTTPNSRIMNPQPQYLYQQSISIVCDTGYTLQGQSTLTCQADKSWSPSIPACSKVQCPAPTTTPNSRIINLQPQYLYQQSISIVCDTGYTLQGQSTLTCQADKTWSHSFPACSKVQCPSPTTTPNSTIVNPQPQYLYQQSISIVCDTGYTLQGQSTLTCQADKSWSHSFPTCSINECPEPTVFNSSIVETKATFEYQDTVTIKCNTGYTLKGLEKMTCQADKTWSTAPTCEINECPEPEKVINSSIVEAKTNYVYQDTVTIKCNTGYTLKGQEKMTCQADKTWTSSPTCEINECAAPSNISNGSIMEIKAKYVYQDILTIICNAGYKRQGQEKMTCQANETWSDAPICAINECAAPVNITNGSFLENKAKYVYQDIIIIQCNTGYTRQGQEKMACQANKTWSEAPICSINECAAPDKIANGSFLENKAKYVYQDILTVKCNTGYTRRGQEKMACQANETWSDAPICAINECAAPGKIANGSFLETKAKYVYQDILTIKCNTGHTRQGQEKITCQANETWSNTPICEINKCPSLKSIPNSNIRNSEEVYRYNDVVAFVCNAGYVLQGSSQLTCQANKEWDMEPPTCIEEETPVAAIAGGVIGSMAAVTLVIAAIFIICRSRLSKKKASQPTAIMAFQDIETHDENEKEQASDNEYANIGTGANEANNIYYNVEEVKQEGRIQITNLKDYMRVKNKETFLQEKFKDLLSGLQRPTEEAVKPKNRPKNKYRNIYPYDDNRICLKLQQGIPDSDFINASPIKGYDGNIKYIAAQGPQDLTYCDFWRMVVEQDIRKIVMLTNPYENGVKKCIQYWPDEETLVAGTVTIELQSTDKFADYTVRRMKVTKGGDTSFVHQYHFSSWPDKGVPKCPSVLAQFHKRVCDMPVHGGGPLLIHCSAGIGRTGTFIALDYLLDEASDLGSVNAFAALENIREQRVNMVQTKDQYIFLHYVLIEALELRSSTITASVFPAKYKEMLAQNKTTGKTPLQQQYEFMKKSVSYPVDDTALIGKREANIMKNRYNDILPTDANRVFLSGSDVDESYINAVYLPGYRDSRAYIITQTPLSNTMEHFWQLIYDENITTVVMMNQESNPDEQYWPEIENKPMEFGEVSVSLMSMKAESNFRTLSLEVCRDNEKRVVKQYQVTFWADTEPAPTSTFPMLQIIDKIQEWAHQNENRPILVHCMNGADKSGLLCSAMAFLDRLKSEQDVCIQTVIKQLRTIRPQIIPNMDQFRFCYDLAGAYIDSFETYSNFV